MKIKIYRNEHYNVPESFKEAFLIYAYDEEGKRKGIYAAPSKEEFEANKSKYCEDCESETTYISYTEIINAVIENGKVREATLNELIEAGFIELKDGEYLDGEEIKTIPKPNQYSIWNKNTHEWVEDKTLKKDFLEHKRYDLQQKYISLKAKKEKLEEEKTEFESLGFDTNITEENIKIANDEMKKIIAEIKEITKELKVL